MILSDIPEENVDYQMKRTTSENWIRGDDGYYYYASILQPKQSTENIIDECTSTTNKNLVVDILTQSIQAQPSQAVQEAWKVNVVDERIEVN